MVLQGNKNNMSLPSDLMLQCFCMYETIVELSQMLQRIVACSLNIVGYTLYYDDNNVSWTDICGSTFMVPWSGTIITCLNLGVLCANKKIFLGKS